MFMSNDGWFTEYVCMHTMIPWNESAQNAMETRNTAFTAFGRKQCDTGHEKATLGIDEYWHNCCSDSYMAVEALHTQPP
jgi:hypothetical protein